MERSIRYEEWMQRLLKSSTQTQVSQHVLQEFIKQWDERTVSQHERELLDLEDAG